MQSGLRLAGCATIALFAAACSQGEGQVRHTVSNDTPVRVAARLDCPQREGDLRLQSAAADGSACAYRGDDGAEVELRLAAAEALPGLESELKALVPGAEAPEPPTPPSPPERVGDDKGRFAIPDVIDVRGEGERASVRLPGVSIEADGDRAEVRVGDGRGRDDVSVRAHDGGAVVRISGAVSVGDVRSTFLVTSDEPGPSGLRLAGYQARGSRPGSMVIGVIRARGEGDNNLMDDVEDLVDRNIKD